jgi:tetratricopeptide (TPR) repeat protein
MNHAGTDTVRQPASEQVAPSYAGSDLAIRYFDQAVRLSFDGRFAESEALSRLAIALSPNDGDILFELGIAVWRQGRLTEAEPIFRRASQLKPDDCRVLTNLGLAVYHLGRIDEAAALYQRALEIEPDSFDAIMNLGVVISDQGQFNVAAQWLEKAISLRPESADALENMGVNLARQCRIDEAITYYEAALRLRPDAIAFHLNLAYQLLSRGDYKRGWVEHEWRLKLRADLAGRLRDTLWNGDDLQGRTILLHFEQGYGDTLQFIRYADAVKRRGCRVVVLCQTPLVELIARCAGVDVACDGSGPATPCDVHAPLASMPYIFGTTLDTVPAPVRYLVPDSELADHWRRELAWHIGTVTGDRSAREFRIGIAWQGNPELRRDRWRSIPLERFAPLAAVPGARLISLQTTHGLDQLHSPDRRFPVIELANRRGLDFDETAAIISNLDLVICPDTALAHLAGGLGLPVWMGLSAVGDWKYPLGLERTRWYPTMKIFRQTALGDWDGVMKRMADALAQTIAGRPALVA